MLSVYVNDRKILKYWGIEQTYRYIVSLLVAVQSTFAKMNVVYTDISTGESTGSRTKWFACLPRQLRKIYCFIVLSHGRSAIPSLVRLISQRIARFEIMQIIFPDVTSWTSRRLHKRGFDYKTSPIPRAKIESGMLPHCQLVFSLENKIYYQ